VEISAASFRDHRLEALGITYNWETLSHSVEVSVRSYDGITSIYRVEGVASLNLVEDFNHIAEIEFCTVLASPGRIYISFDPYTEGVESEADNFCIVGQHLALVRRANL
jgi:hypothetical protein